MASKEKYATKTFSGKGMWGSDLIVFDSLESTNKWVMSEALNLSHGDIVIAENQTAGRGRLNRTWFSQKGKSLCFSVFMEKHKIKPVYFLATQITALSIAGFLEQMGLSPKLKWPNDVMINNKKICGILAQTNSTCSFIVIGAGLNINLTENDIADYGLNEISTSLFIETGKKHDIMEVFKNIKTEMETTFSSGSLNSEININQSWQKYDYFSEEQIVLKTAGKDIKGTYQGLDAKGRIVLLLPEGELKSFYAGDIRKVRS